MNKYSLSYIWTFRTQMLLLLHVALFCLAYLAAIMLRFDFTVPAERWDVWLRSLYWLLPIKVAVFYYAGSFHGWWRYVTLSDLTDLIRASIISTLCIAAVDYFVVNEYQVPRGILVLDWLVTVLLFGALRASIRLIRERSWPMHAAKDIQRAVIVGLDDHSITIARLLNVNPRSGYRAVGFLNNNGQRHVGRVAGIPVLGSSASVGRFASQVDASTVLVAADSLSGNELNELLERCREAELAVKVVPLVEDIMSGRYKFQVREVNIDDLLHRDPVELDAAALTRLLQGRRVMVTGAGGSIGAEICRQALKFHPKSVILVERFENALFHVERQLRAVADGVELHPCIADVTDVDRMETVFKTYQPEIVFHTAAHKHVPLMEEHPGEAIKNNVFGTKCVADAASRHDVAHFVLISTDKAVNPTSVMGVSKRLAERYILATAHTSATKFVVVRFGNVLGSNGSVVQIFREQILRGGPITITDPRMQRYFMTIPEASQLVMQAASMGKGGEVFVLDMGEPVKIVDLARDMIQLSGLKSADIAIETTGIRPGEKLFEELERDEEELLSTSHPKVAMAHYRAYDDEECGFIRELQQALGSSVLLLEKLHQLVPEYESGIDSEALEERDIEDTEIRSEAASEMYEAPESSKTRRSLLNS